VTVAMISAEIVKAPEPLSESKAKALDKKIRAACIKVSDNAATLLDLLEEAAVGQIHVAMGYDNWAAYVKDAVNITPADINERKALVSMMSGKGLSQRAIANVVGVDQKTISNDLRSSEENSSVDITGLDGRAYKRKEKEPAPEPLDVEEVEPPAEKIRPVSQDFRDEMYNLQNTVAAFKDILEDERFPKATKAIAKRHMNDLQDAIKDLQGVIDALMEG